VSVNADFQDFRLEIYNSLGQHVQTQYVEGTLSTLSIGRFAPGPYLLRAIGPDGRDYRTRLIKQ